ncbi:MAG: hypothetical protein U0P45_09370 [Acidimicrobiales bacterium]
MIAPGESGLAAWQRSQSIRNLGSSESAARYRRRVGGPFYLALAVMVLLALAIALVTGLQHLLPPTSSP